MMRITLSLAATLLAGSAIAQTASPTTTAPGSTVPSMSTTNTTTTNTATGTPSGTGVIDRNTGTAAASGDRNQAVATTSANAPAPARGANSFTQAEARRRLERNGFSAVTGLRKDEAGVWRGTGSKAGQQGAIWLDYKGNAGTGDAAAVSASSMSRTTPATTRTGMAPDGTPGNPPGTAAGRAMDRTLGTNTTGTNPAGSNATTR